MKKIPVLFTNTISIYDTIPIFDAWNATRNAFLSDHRTPAIYHPPCRLFSRLRKFSAAHITEKKCAFWSLSKVRQFGGILEHPRSSTLWYNGNFHLDGTIDAYGGFLRSVDLSWFGFPARKKTMLYFVGITPAQLPPFPLPGQPPIFVIGTSKRQSLPELPKKKRSETPLSMVYFFFETIKIMQNENTKL